MGGRALEPPWAIFIGMCVLQVVLSVRPTHLRTLTECRPSESLQALALKDTGISLGRGNEMTRIWWEADFLKTNFSPASTSQVSDLTGCCVQRLWGGLFYPDSLRHGTSLWRPWSLSTPVSVARRIRCPHFTFQLSLASSLRRKGGDSGVVTCVRS